MYFADANCYPSFDTSEILIIIFMLDASHFLVFLP